MFSPAKSSVFIADDDPGALNSLRFFLEAEGFEVSAFPSGADLLAQLPNATPTCVVVDCKMPGMDGLEVCRRVRDMRSDIPAILVTGHPDPTIVRRAHECGLPLVEKPLSQEALLNAVAAASTRGPWPVGPFRAPVAEDR